MTSEPTVSTQHGRHAEHVVVRLPSPRRLLRSLLPEATVKHLYAARREQLLALRSIVDAAIERVEAAERETPTH